MLLPTVLIKIDIIEHNISTIPKVNLDVLHFVPMKKASTCLNLRVMPQMYVLFRSMEVFSSNPSIDPSMRPSVCRLILVDLEGLSFLKSKTHPPPLNI